MMTYKETCSQHGGAGKAYKSLAEKAGMKISLESCSNYRRMNNKKKLMIQK
jgi:hypothetical protein